MPGKSAKVQEEVCGNSIRKKSLDLDADESTAKSPPVIQDLSKKYRKNTPELAQVLSLTVNRLSPASCQNPCGLC